MSVFGGDTTTLTVGLGTRAGTEQYAALLAGAPPAITCEAREILLEPDKIVDCRRVVHMGIVEVRGCLHRVLSLRGTAGPRNARRLASHARRLLTPLQEEFFHPAYDESSGDAFLAGLIGRSNVFVSDSVIVNGVALSAVDGTRIVTAPEIGAIIGADARVTVVDIRLAARPDFLLDARRAWSGGRLKLGRFARSGGRTKVGGFGLSSDVTLTLVAGGSELGLALELPAFLAGDPQPTIGHVSGDGSLVTDGICLGPFSAELGGVRVQDVALTLHDASSWSGAGSVCLFDDVCVRMDPEHKGGIEIADGELVFAGADVHFPAPVAFGTGRRDDPHRLSCRPASDGARRLHRGCARSGCSTSTATPRSRSRPPMSRSC